MVRLQGPEWQAAGFGNGGRSGSTGGAGRAGGVHLGMQQGVGSSRQQSAQLGLGLGWRQGVHCSLKLGGQQSAQQGLGLGRQPGSLTLFGHAALAACTLRSVAEHNCYPDPGTRTLLQCLLFGNQLPAPLPTDGRI